MQTTQRALAVKTALVILGVIVACMWASRRAPSGVDVPVAAQTTQFNCPGTAKVARADPFANNYGQAPLGYPGPLFKLSHDYPTAKPVPIANAPWRQALQGQAISSQNAIAYVNALKAYVGADMRQLILHYDQWDAPARGWYNEPWIAWDREAIHGAYLGSPFPAGTFSDLKTGMATWVVTYYGKNAAYTVGQVWGADAQSPNVQNAQYQEGAVIVKIAATTASAQDWPSMHGAASWPIYAVRST